MKKLMFLAALGLASIGVSRVTPDLTEASVARPFTEPAALAANPGLQSCPDRYLGAEAPILPSVMDKNAKTLCFSSFATRSSPITRTPVWAAERLTPEIVRSARGIERVSNFFAEQRLAANERSELADYRGSGWDRGHLAPSGDMPDLEAQGESFSLANIIPQAGYLNRNSWADLESDVRNLANRRDVIYVVTGTLYEGATVQRMPTGRVIIPSSIWKAIAAPGEGAVVFVASNDQQPGWAKMSVADFASATGIDPFPALEDDDRNRLLQVGSR
jgi:endonuclease G